MPQISTLRTGFIRPEEVLTLAWARWGIYGKNGVGKTTFVATIPEDVKVIYVSVGSENLRPVIGHKNILPYRINRFNDLARLLDDVDQLIDRGFTGVLAFDTWSRVQDLAIGKIVGYEPLEPGDEKAYIDRIPKKVNGWDGWQQVGALSAEWMRYFNRRPVHTLFLLQENDRERRVAGESTGETETGIRLTPSAFQAFYDDLELIGRLYVDTVRESSEESEGGVQLDALLSEDADKYRARIDENVQEVRKLFIGAHERYRCKGNTALLGRVIDNPTWASLARSLRPE